MADEKESKFMLMVHSDFKDREPAKVLKSQFENRWKEKGWVEFEKGWVEFKEEKKASITTSTSTTDTGGSKDK